MKKLNKTASKYANILRFFTIIALGILGALMLILMFSQLFAIGRIMISNNCDSLKAYGSYKLKLFNESRNYSPFKKFNYCAW